ncbi:MAG: PspC domain-containing protein [Actinomycetia bacterium]|nr:PspC domain-containing protein [Actinomycetes bacterium]
MTDEPFTPDPNDSGDPPPSLDDLIPPSGDTPPSSEDTPPATPPPPPPHQVGSRRLVRDPYSRLGGVASGVATHYGFDVSIVRIMFILVAFGTGFGFLAYLLAWLIIPRADYWPPAGARTTSRSLSRRDLGLGLAAGGLLLALAFGGGSTGSFLVPVILVGGGVWLLVQIPTNGSVAGVASAGAAPVGATPGGSGAVPGGAGPVSGPVVSTTGAPPPPPPPPPFAYAAPSPPGPPVPPRSSGRRFGIALIVIAGILALLVIPLLALVGLVVFGISHEIIDERVDITLTPTSVEELPIDIEHDVAEIVVDLTGLTPEELGTLDDPATIDIRADVGSIRVIVPDDLAVSVDAESDLGEVSVFNDSDSGISNDVTSTVEDPDLEIDLNLDIGEIDVVRG